MAKVGADFEAQLCGEMEGEADQVHRLIHYGPQHSVSAMVNSLKGFPAGYYEAQDLIWPTNTGREYFWSPSYLAATWGGAAISILKQYIESQMTPT